MLTLVGQKHSVILFSIITYFNVNVEDIFQFARSYALND